MIWVSFESMRTDGDRVQEGFDLNWEGYQLEFHLMNTIEQIAAVLLEHLVLRPEKNHANMLVLHITATNPRAAGDPRRAIKFHPLNEQWTGMQCSSSASLPSSLTAPSVKSIPPSGIACNQVVTTKEKPEKADG